MKNILSLGLKLWIFFDFCKAAELVKNKVHLTKEGLDQIRLIKMGMNNLNFGTINKINITHSKFVVYYFELKYILVPLFIMNNLHFLTRKQDYAI